jgi:hypothetical protein
LSAAVLAAISRSAELKRGAGPEGKEKLLTGHERSRLSALWGRLDSSSREQIGQLVAGSKSDVGRTLILRATVARLSELLGRNSESAVQKISEFSSLLAKYSDEEILRRASVLDRNSLANDNLQDPMSIVDRRGIVRARTEPDIHADNDGLNQRYTASCGPSVLQMMLAEADPIYAFALNRATLASGSTNDPIARFQRNILEDFGGIALGQGIAQLRARTRNAAGRLLGKGELTQAEVAAFRTYAEKKGPLDKDAAAALGIIRRENDGFPSSRELSQLRKTSLPSRDEGIGFDSFAAALGKLLTPLTGISYRQTTPAGGFARGQSWRHLDAVERVLKRGVDVPFGTCEPSHWMLMTAVDGKKPSRRFLVSDPLGGRTSWVTERDLIKGTFVDAQFFLSVGRERGFIDCFYLP